MLFSSNSASNEIVSSKVNVQYVRKKCSFRIKSEMYN